MPRVFISYRRGDTATVVGRLYDQLAWEFGKDNVFRDIYSIAPGSDFESAIQQTLTSCDVCLAIIGPNWHVTNVSQSGGAQDYVYIEIEQALKHELRVIPVLVDRATLPSEQALPESLRPFLRRQAVELSDSRWEYDVGVLLESLAAVAPRGGRPVTPTPAGRWAWTSGPAAGAALVAANVSALIGLGLQLTVPLTPWSALAARVANPLVAMVILATALVVLLVFKSDRQRRPRLASRRRWLRLQAWIASRSGRQLFTGTVLLLSAAIWIVPTGVAIEERSVPVDGDFCGRFFVDSRMQADLAQQCPGDRNVGSCGATAFSCRYYEIRIFSGLVPPSQMVASIAISGVRSEGAVVDAASVSWADGALEKVNDPQWSFSWDVGGREINVPTPRGAIPRTFRILATRQHDPNTPPARIDIAVTVATDTGQRTFTRSASFDVRNEQ